MPTIDHDIIGFTIEYTSDGVIFNGKIFMKKPKACSYSDWENLWERLDKNFGYAKRVFKDGLQVVDLDEEID